MHIERLFINQSNMNSQDKNGLTFLHIVWFYYQVNNNININIFVIDKNNDIGLSPLYLACKYNHDFIIKILLLIIKLKHLITN